MKKLLLTVFALLAFSSFGFADTESDIEHEITMGKIQAAEIQLEIQDIENKIEVLLNLQEQIQTGPYISAIGQMTTVADLVIENESDDLNKLKDLNKDLEKFTVEVKNYMKSL